MSGEDPRDFFCNRWFFGGLRPVKDMLRYPLSVLSYISFYVHSSFAYIFVFGFGLLDASSNITPMQ
jgi:hypothetical protein